MKEPIDRLAAMTSVSSSGCHEFTGKLTRGYGRITLRSNRMVYAHRLSWESARGPIPTGLKVLHICDNPRCVNIDHLFLGTQKDNIADCIAKGRRGKRSRVERQDQKAA